MTGLIYFLKQIKLVINIYDLLNLITYVNNKNCGGLKCNKYRQKWHVSNEIIK